MLLTMALLAVGCAPASRSAAPAVPESSFPLSLRGQDTHVQFDFKAHPAIAINHQFQSDELCYLMIGEAVIMCTEDGSYLIFGPGDGVILVRDNPLSQLRPASDDPAGQEWIDVFGTIFLIAGSVDRLPDALSDYLATPGPHHREAAALARKMLADNGATLPIAGRGNTFAITFRLTESGRDKLSTALQSDDATPGVLKVGNIFTRRRDNPLNKRLP